VSCTWPATPANPPAPGARGGRGLGGGRAPLRLGGQPGLAGCPGYNWLRRPWRSAALSAYQSWWVHPASCSPLALTVTMAQSLLLSLAASASLLAGVCSSVLAQQPVQPLPKVGGCPLGYYSSGGYCVPSSGGNTRGAIEKSGAGCPLGFYSSGNYCLSSPSNEREAIQKSGKGCPLGWYSTSSYCVRSR